MKVSFPKSEKLKSQKQIDQLFLEGKSIKQFPLRLIYMPVPKQAQSQVAFAVPKRLFNHAVDRNRIKRQMREAYRLQKGNFSLPQDKNLAMVFVYMAKQVPQYKQLEKSVSTLLSKAKADIS